MEIAHRVAGMEFRLATDRNVGIIQGAWVDVVSPGALHIMGHGSEISNGQGRENENQHQQRRAGRQKTEPAPGKIVRRP